MSDREREIDGQEVTQLFSVGERLFPVDCDDLRAAIVELLNDAAVQGLRITNDSHRRTIARRVMWLIGAES